MNSLFEVIKSSKFHSYVCVPQDSIPNPAHHLFFDLWTNLSAQQTPMEMSNTMLDSRDKKCQSHFPSVLRELSSSLGRVVQVSLA